MNNPATKTSEVIDLLKYYGITIKEDETAPIVNELIGLCEAYHADMVEEDHAWKRSAKEIISLIQLLRLCKFCDIDITGTITAPQKNYIKGTEHKITITDWEFLNGLERFAESWLQNKHGAKFKLFSSIEPKGTIEAPAIFNKAGLIGLFHNEELDKILQGLKPTNEVKGNAKKGMLASYIERALAEYGLSAGWYQVKRYSFVYDLMRRFEITHEKNTIYEESFSGDIGREKSKIINGWIKAYEKHRSK